MHIYATNIYTHYGYNFLKKLFVTVLDGLELTRKWLQESADDLKAKVQQSTPPSTTTSGPSAGPRPMMAYGPAAILNHGYVRLFKWKEDELFPEV